MSKISTGSSDLDQLFQYDSSALTLIYGEAATGKTTLSLLATLAHAQKQKMIYIYT